MPNNTNNVYKDFDFQAGDEVYLLIDGQMHLSKITLIDKSLRCPVRVDGYGAFTLDGKLSANINYTSLFHKEAITFDEEGRFIAIDYNFRPDRNLKVRVTKLPHEFVKGEKVLVRYCITNMWKPCTFESLSNDELYPYTIKVGSTWRYCIPFEGNEHLKNKITTCTSGEAPKGYDYAEYVTHIMVKNLKPFDKVLVRDDKADKWQASFFSYISDIGTHKYQCLWLTWRYCIPLNEDTMHLIGTADSWKY